MIRIIKPKQTKLINSLVSILSIVYPCMFTFTQDTNCVIKRHGLDVEGGEDCLFVCQSGVIIGGDLQGIIFLCISETLTKPTLADRITHMSHRLTLTARRSALLRGEPFK